jgi:hypothetical protein
MSEMIATVVRDAGPGLSGTEAALYGGLGGGLIGGILALLGVIVERVLRLVAFLRFEVYEWERKFTKARNDWGDYEEIMPEEAATLAKRVGYSLAVDLFNGKEVPTGLRDIKVALVRKDGEPLTSRPQDRQSGSRDSRSGVLRYSRVGVLNIQPRQFVRMELQGEFDRAGALALAAEMWERIEFVGERPKPPSWESSGARPTARPSSGEAEEGRRRPRRCGSSL